MSREEIRLLYDYDKWADLKILETVAPLTDDQFGKDLGSSFGGIRGTLVHILSANQVWLNRWTGKEQELLKVDNFSKIEILKKRFEVYHFDINNFLQSSSEEKLNNLLQYTDFKGNKYEQPLFQQMQHKVNHSSYHRGQIIMMLRQLDKPVVSTDLINYIRQNGTRN